MGKFPAWIPEGCPQEATEVNATLYRGCETNPPTPEDFTPHARSNLPRKQRMARDGSCLGFGLSVWVSEADAKHAQELFPWAGRWHIFKGNVSQGDGRLAPTGTRQQPGHHSFWVYQGINLMIKFSPALPPMTGAI